MILFDNVTKKYQGQISALDSISLKIGDGEFVFIIGPSGAGKTTLLKLITREILPTHGSIFLDDWEINKLPTKKVPFLRRKVGVIFQDFKLLPNRTVGENVSVTLEILGQQKKEIRDRISTVLSTVGLAGKDNYFPKQLSLGEQQRVAIARAIAGEAKVLLADEPTGNLDPKTSWEILKTISTINKTGTTILMATHNVDIVNSMKKRLIRLGAGKVEADQKKSKYI